MLKKLKKEAMRKSIRYTSLIAAILLGIQVQAQSLEDLIGFEDNVNDSGITAAPVDSSIYVLLVFGGCLGVWQLRKVSEKRKANKI